MKKKITAIALVVAILAVGIIGGTLAYFTDTTEAKVNTFTVGNVSIKLIESTFHREGNDNSGDTSIPDPNNVASGMEYVTAGHKAFTDAEIQANAEGYAAYLAERGKNIAPGIAAAKCPYVINTSKTNSAYIRIRVLVPSAANNDFVNVKEGGVITNQWCSTSMISGEFIDGKGGGWNNAPYINRDVNGYDVYTFVRTEPLAPGAMTEWNVWNFIGIAADATAADIQLAVKAGAINEDGSFNVLVQADAIQADGFSNATEAFAAFDAQTK